MTHRVIAVANDGWFIAHVIAVSASSTLPGARRGALTTKLVAVVRDFLLRMAKLLEKLSDVRPHVAVHQGELLDFFQDELHHLAEKTALPLTARDRQKQRESVRNRLHLVRSYLNKLVLVVDRGRNGTITYRLTIPEVEIGKREQTYQLFIGTSVRMNTYEKFIRHELLEQLFSAAPENLLHRFIALDVLGEEHAQFVSTLRGLHGMTGFVRTLNVLDHIASALWPDRRAVFLSSIFSLPVSAPFVGAGLFDFIFIETAFPEVKRGGVKDAIILTHCLTTVEKIVALIIVRECGEDSIGKLVSWLYQFTETPQDLVPMAAAIDEASVSMTPEFRVLVGASLAVGKEVYVTYPILDESAY